MAAHVNLECDCDNNCCQFCVGGLWACAICDSFEGATTTDCPGKRMTFEQSQEVYAGRLDFVNGLGWIPQPSLYTPNHPERLKHIP